MSNRLSELPQALKDVRAELTSIVFLPNQLFYGFTGGGARLDVGASITVYVLDEQGAPEAGVFVYNARPDGKWERLATGGNGAVEFELGRGSYFFAPQRGPHTVFVGSGVDRYEDDDGRPHFPTPKILSDMLWSLGLPEGHHCDYSITFRMMKANGNNPPPPPGGDSLQRIADDVEAIAERIRKLL